MTITNYTPETILASLMSAKPALTSEAPQDSRGIYGLIDHEGCLRYIGSTSSSQQTLFERIHRCHRSGSEDKSHYFARMYNTGRMYRDRNNPAREADGKIAKRLRNAFIAEHCRAVWVCLPDNFAIGAIEQQS